jgi:hypothetical protein
MRPVLFISLLALAQPVVAQSAASPDEEPVIITGVADGARVVTVDFDKVWKNCAECKRALKKLDKLAQAYRDERDAALLAVQRPPNATGVVPIGGVSDFQRSSAQDVGTMGYQLRTGRNVQDSVHGSVQASQADNYLAELDRRYIRPELINVTALSQSFLDQLAPHLREATEAERIVHGASVGLTDAKRSKVSAKDLTQIDVTDAVIKRLDSMDFTIDLPEPRKSPARRK